jgi:hypothetical protein
MAFSRIAHQGCKNKHDKIHDSASDTLALKKAVLADSATPPIFNTG